MLGEHTKSVKGPQKTLESSLLQAFSTMKLSFATVQLDDTEKQLCSRPWTGSCCEHCRGHDALSRRRLKRQQRRRAPVYSTRRQHCACSCSAASPEPRSKTRLVSAPRLRLSGLLKKVEPREIARDEVTRGPEKVSCDCGSQAMASTPRANTPVFGGTREQPSFAALGRKSDSGSDVAGLSSRLNGTHLSGPAFTAPQQPTATVATLSASTSVGAMSSCASEARRAAEVVPSDTDLVSVDELAGYLDTLVYIPRKMSHMAEMMYT